MVGTTAYSAGHQTAGSLFGMFTPNLSSVFDYKQMDHLTPVPTALGTSLLWLYFQLPSATTTNNAQNISLTITAIAPN